ncbi:hypothetical protein KW791_00600 [Candidatus Parcubacteria bacterium]|nr:hypothetical protein [Candidatus Parcubacteria bacterium]
MSVTRWGPDTCKCLFDFEPDPNDGTNQILIEVLNICSEHKGLSGKDLHQTVLKQENQHKNKIHSKLLELDAMAEDITQDDGSVIRRFKKGVGFDFNFTGKDDSRTLNITTKGHVLSGAQKAALTDFSLQETGKSILEIK